ncbi:MAG TPA: methylenetetrahydrofolate reductase [Acidimicrobiales bacterium]|nr:methylenetetrahydrofolate reductase [Acidimicrobiales bacterium]
MVPGLPGHRQPERHVERRCATGDLASTADVWLRADLRSRAGDATRSDARASPDRCHEQGGVSLPHPRQPPGASTVSSVAVAHEVAAMGGRSIACLNARDRNVLGFRRDLLTAAAYGVDTFLLVYGDRPSAGHSGSGELNVRRMMEEIRSFGAGPEFAGRPPFRIGVTSRLSAVPAFKREADFLFAQMCFSCDAVLRWRERVAFDGPIYAGVMVLASGGMARKLADTVTEIDIPAELVERVDRDHRAGVELACEQVEVLRDSEAFDGVHLVPVSRYREVAARLEASEFS